jgi:regulator of sirC expression with transglutaminase-like and TPR domain
VNRILSIRFWILLASCCLASTAHAGSFTRLEWILNAPEANIDLAKAKLTIDHMIDPNVDEAATGKVLDAMATAIKASLPPNASKQNTLIGLRRYLYLAGEWNNFKPFSYDLDDPLGANIQNKVIATYLTTRKGNCVSMPILVLLLGQKLGLDISLSTVPTHLFLKFRDDSGKTVNLEATDHAAPMSDARYQVQMPMTELAIKNGIYMQPLHKKEAISVMMGTLMEHYKDSNQLDKIIALADLALKYYPKNVDAMLMKGAAYGETMNQEFKSKYPTENLVPFELLPRLADLSHNTNYWYDQAEALGFRPPDQASEDAYKLRIQQEKARQQKDRENAVH